MCDKPMSEKEVLIREFIDNMPPILWGYSCFDDDYTITQILLRIKLVRAIIRERYPESDKFIEDKMPCPTCKTGTIYFVISDHYNGHIHAHCTTKDCINWME